MSKSKIGRSAFALVSILTFGNPTAWAGKPSCGDSYSHDLDVDAPLKSIAIADGFKTREMKIYLPTISLHIAAGRTHRGITINVLVGTGQDASVMRQVKELLDDALGEFIIPGTEREFSTLGYAYTLRASASTSINRRFEELEKTVEERLILPALALPESEKSPTRSTRVEVIFAENGNSAYAKPDL